MFGKTLITFQLSAGSLVASIGLGSFLIPTPLKYEHLSRNPESNEKVKKDPFCEQVGSLRGVADMLNGGISLDSKDTWDRWPKGLPLLVYHGEEDPICDPRAAERFAQGVQGDKTFYLVKVGGCFVINGGEAVVVSLNQANRHRECYTKSTMSSNRHQPRWQKSSQTGFMPGWVSL